jgi:protease-4
MSKAGKRVLLIVLILVAGLVTVAFMLRMASQPARGSVLELVLDDEIPDQETADGLAQLFGGRKLTMRDYVEALRLARDDRRINGLLVTIDGPDVGTAKLQELRDAIVDFQKGDKWAVAYLETAGEFSPGNRDYYLATACGSIWLAPPGDINLVGIHAEVPFFRGALDRLGVVPDMDHIGKYKSAMNTITDKAMNEAYRESMEALVSSVYGQLKRGIAQGRRLKEEQVASLIDNGPYIGPRALEAKLVDTLGYRDDLETHLKEKNGGSLPLVKVGKYLKAGRYFTRGPKIALVYGLGGVSRGENDSNPATGSLIMGSDTTAAAIKKAREDPSIRAIVFRVDSPGGSYIASDVIYHEVMLTKDKKPFVVSMGDVAGSGGYFVSMGANKIVAEPATITASIGVLAGKMVTTGLWNKVGITFDAVQRGRHATFFSTGSKYTPEERDIFEGWLQRIYKDFVDKAAKGRGKTYDEIHAVAQGRIWSGEDALRLGLVDELGGLTTAIRRALELAHIDPESRVQLVVLPEPKSFLDRIWSGFEDTRAPFASLQRRLLKFIEEGPSDRPDGVLSMPFVPVLR